MTEPDAVQEVQIEDEHRLIYAPFATRGSGILRY